MTNELNLEQERREFIALKRSQLHKDNLLHKESDEDFLDYYSEQFEGWLDAKRAAMPVTTLDADALAQEIRRVDGKHTLGAAALAEALMPMIQRAATGEAG